jgi:hypothetical protein
VRVAGRLDRGEGPARGGAGRGRRGKRRRRAARRRRGERAGAGRRGGAAARRAGGRGEAAAREGAAASERAARRNRVRMSGEKGRRRAVYLLSLSSARDLTLGKDFLKILKYSLPSARSLALSKVFFAECHLWALGKLLFYFFIFPTNFFVVCYYTM